MTEVSESIKRDLGDETEATVKLKVDGAEGSFNLTVIEDLKAAVGETLDDHDSQTRLSDHE